MDMDIFSREEPLCAGLLPYVTDGPMGKMVHHPLLIHLFFDPQRCGLINAQYDAKSKAIAEYIDAGKFHSAIFMHERPYRFDALSEYIRDYDFDRMDTFWETVGSVWTDSENIHENFEDWQWVWEHDSPNRELAMTEEEREAFAALPDRLELFRGVGKLGTGTNLGMSWTLDRDKAIWFAKRFHKNGRLLSTTIDKKHALAHFTGRNESEIVVLPHNLGFTSDQVKTTEC